MLGVGGSSVNGFHDNMICAGQQGFFNVSATTKPAFVGFQTIVLALIP
ncbi:hypothetical Protein YC6258_02850 [Gynuella sunshinyii YC6258]|uniref:Uncharacterized protein n=1 Tax=Gynuella sunshinyii YC6258 TaxID=1445510 RepID=A0A0C5VND0_9GAMM|nr:hypothetical Protein YC6258_02850 [Gynuella sunshinyii YC6258]